MSGSSFLAVAGYTTDVNVLKTTVAPPQDIAFIAKLD